MFWDWKNHPVTALLMKWAELKRTELMELWATGNLSGQFTNEMIAKNAGATGACSILQDLLDIDYEEMEGVNHE